jgi:hypothetical protein
MPTPSADLKIFPTLKTLRMLHFVSVIRRIDHPGLATTLWTLLPEPTLFNNRKTKVAV